MRRELDSTFFAERIARVRRSLEEMAENIDFVRSELASLSVVDEVRSSIRVTCDDFSSALYDVRKEVWALADTLAPGDVPFHPAETSGDPRATMSLIRTWLRREIEKVHALVISLQADPALSVAYVLVAESGVNILHALSSIEVELDEITATLVQADKS